MGRVGLVSCEGTGEVGEADGLNGVDDKGGGVGDGGEADRLDEGNDKGDLGVTDDFPVLCIVTLCCTVDPLVPILVSSFSR